MGYDTKMSYHNLSYIFSSLFASFSPADTLNSSFSNIKSAAVAAIDIDKKSNKTYISQNNTINVYRFEKKSRKKQLRRKNNINRKRTVVRYMVVRLALPRLFELVLCVLISPTIGENWNIQHRFP